MKEVDSFSNYITTRKENHPEWSPFWLHAEIVFFPFPWNWSLRARRTNSRELSIRLGPIGIEVIDG